MPVLTVKAYLSSAGAILAATAAIKVASVFGVAPILDALDPLFHLRMRLLLLLVAASELVAATIIFSARSPVMGATACATMGAEFILYRTAARLMGERHCPCLGTVTQWLRIDDARVVGLLWATAAYLFAGGLLVLYQHQRQSKARPATGRVEG